MKNLKKIMSTVLALLMVLSLFAEVNTSTVKASTLNSGKMNSAGSVNWKITSDGVLTITGTGKPDSYSNATEVPWYSYMSQISSVQIDAASNEITSMAYWFEGAYNLVSINRFPTSLISLRQTFKDCVKITSVPEIPSTVTTVRNAFYGCTALNKFPELPKNITDYTGAFRNCKALTFVYVNLTDAATAAKTMLKGCENADVFLVFSNTKNLKASETTEMIEGTATAERRNIVAFYTGDTTKAQVKNYLGSYNNKVGVAGYMSQKYIDYKSQCGYAYSATNFGLYLKGKSFNTTSTLSDFKYKTNVKTLKVGAGITDIKDSSFSGYSALETVMFNSDISKIGAKAFYGCSKMTSISINGTKTIGASAFANCSSLGSLFIPETITEIGENAFKGTSSNFYLVCTDKNGLTIEYAENHGLKCKYPKSLNVEYRGNVVEGCPLDENEFGKIQLVYSDGSSLDLSYEDIAIEEYEIVPGTNEIIASYGEFETVFEVTGLEKTVISLEAEYNREDFIEIEGGKINPDALTVKASYDNGTEGYLEYGGMSNDPNALKGAGYYNFDDYELMIGNNNEVTIRVNVSDSLTATKSIKINIPARKKKITGLSAQYIGGAIVEGMGINPENICVYATFDNASREEILFSGEYNTYGTDIDTDYNIIDKTVEHTLVYEVSDEYTYTIDAYEILRNSNNLITVWCDSCSASINVQGIAKSVSGIVAEYNGTIPEEGDLDISKLTLNIKYNNGETEELEDYDNLTISETYIIGIGDNNIEIGYKDPETGKRYSTTVYVEGTKKIPVAIEDAQMRRTDIVEGEKLNGQEINVTVLYNNEKTYDHVIAYEGNEIAKEGENILKFKFEGLEGTASFKAIEFIPNIVTANDTEVPASLVKDDTLMLKVTSKTPSVLEGKVVGWESSDEKVLTVSDTGKVTAVSFGTAKIKATVNGKTVSCTIKVIIPAKSISINKANAQIVEGQTLNLSTAIEPSNSTDTITWSSSNDKIARVSNKGVVTAMGSGKAIITVTTLSGKTATCKVTVLKEANKISLNKKSAEIIKGKSVKLKYTLPKNTASKKISWISSNSKIVKVDKKGKVTAVKAGTAYVLVTTASGATAKCKIVVKNIATSISLNKKEVTLKLGKNTTLKYSVPKNTIANGIKWSTSNKKVAYINNGKITGVGIGKAVITVKMSNGKKASCTVTVR